MNRLYAENSISNLTTTKKHLDATHEGSRSEVLWTLVEIVLGLKHKTYNLLSLDFVLFLYSCLSFVHSVLLIPSV